MARKKKYKQKHHKINSNKLKKKHYGEN